MIEKIVTNLILYVLTYISAVKYRKEEYNVALIQFIILVILILNHTKEKIIPIVLFGIIMTIAEYVSIKNYKMWEYKNIEGVIPKWLVLTWIIVGYFCVDIYNFLK